MANLLKLEMESINNSVEELMKNETIAHKVHMDLQCISDSIKAAIRMMDMLYSVDSPMIASTSKNTSS